LRERISEIHQRAVTHQIRDTAVKARHRGRNDALKGVDQITHVLRVKPRRQRCRANEIAEYHG
jgi:hypothetical protein